MHLAHTHLLGGHLGPSDTLENLRDCLYWPGMMAKVQRFCQQCPQCQHTALLPLALAPLIPLPIIWVPSEWVGLDLVELQLKFTQGHEYILVILDYATCYVEDIPCCKAISQDIAKELVLLFSWVGIPKDAD